jgi:hypothetical protein
LAYLLIITIPNEIDLKQEIMKTLKHNLVVAMLAICIATVTASAQKNKVAKGSVVRARLLDLLSGTDVKENGLADIFFKLESDRITVLNVEGNNLKLNKQIMNWLEINTVYINGAVGYFQVTINMNAVKEASSDAQEKIHEMISEILNRSEMNTNGEARIMFCVSDRKQLKVLDVKGSDNYLSSPVKNMINDADLSVPEGLKGNYEVNVKF